MIRVGITGQTGFIGTHLFNYLNLNEGIKLITFSDTFFEDKSILNDWVSSCDVIVHLAAVNRHADQSVLYETNIRLIQQLIDSLDSTGSTPHIIFSSSTQEERDNLYGKSKRDGRNLFIQWSQRNSSVFTGLVIPNVFGPFGNPFYNSVIATFSYQLTHLQEPVIDKDSELHLIYVGELVREIHDVIISSRSENEYYVPSTKTIKVSEILKMVQEFKTGYFENSVIPVLQDRFEINLFNTFRSYIDPKGKFPVLLKKSTDGRGSFVEILKTGQGGQVSYSTTLPGITRGNHFHTRKIERFAVIKGKASIQLRKIGSTEVLNFDLEGSEPAFVDMPVWYTHNIINTGTEELYTIFWINEFYDPSDPDTFIEPV